MTFKYITLFFLLTLALFSCRETEQFTNSPSATLAFSTDTVQFDTVFTTIGSTTRQFRFYNPNNEAVKTTITLAGGNKSYFRLNVDGIPTDEFRDYEIMANDSAYVFVEVNVDPQNSNNPMVIDDSIMFFTNGNQQNVKLQAFGQDVHLYNDSVIDTRTWIADKPYLIYNNVLIDSAETLTIEAGTQIHFHNESAMYVLGTLNVNGSAEEKVIFQGDRLEKDYEHLPSQWYGYIRNDKGAFAVGGIFIFDGSKGNTIDHAIIKNGSIGIQVYNEKENDNLTLTLSNSIIKNMSAIGLLTQFSNTITYNTTIANCGISAVIHSLGGHHECYHSTIGNYYKFGSRDKPSLYFINNYTDEETNITYSYDFSSIFANSIIYGDQETEFSANFVVGDATTVDILFDHCMMKLNKEFDTSDETIYKDIIRHKDSLPRFVNTYEGNFRLDTLSAAKDKGTLKYSTLYKLDQDGIDRTIDGLPDLGAYERVEGE